MSFGDPNNPYGQQGQQPGYGQPQGPPPGQPGYGYPQGQPQQPGGYGYPSPPPAPTGYSGQMEMPGLMKTARVFLFIFAGFQILAGLVIGIGMGIVGAAASHSSSNAGNALAGIGIVGGVLLVGIGALSIFLGVKFATGGTGIRVTTIVYASLGLLGGLGNLANGGNGGAFSAIISLACSGIILASMVNSSASAWFNRPRY
ncbi:hypothetical protein AB0O07_24070 [Streptomyces sp. NPDC093085]|uniref:hypothetical protein n=1 Tax=Streptomyces sp. NPDC093085 TaxID=3155068 RepID=UPI00341AB25F